MYVAISLLDMFVPSENAETRLLPYTNYLLAETVSNHFHCITQAHAKALHFKNCICLSCSKGTVQADAMLENSFICHWNTNDCIPWTLYTTSLVCSGRGIQNCSYTSIYTYVQANSSIHSEKIWRTSRIPYISSPSVQPFIHDETRPAAAETRTWFNFTRARLQAILQYGFLFSPLLTCTMQSFHVVWLAPSLDLIMISS